MRFSIPYTISPSTGPSLFLKKISTELIHLGHTLVDKTADQDIRLACISEDMEYWNKRNIPVILRLDGIHHNLEIDSTIKNIPILESYKHANAIIFQSEFSKRMVVKHFGDPNTYNHEIIYNGHPQKQSSSPSPVPGKKIIFTAAQWRPHKRLNDVINGFLKWNKPDTVLCIAGTCQNEIQSSNIIYLGRLTQEEMVQYYQHAIAFLHLCWIDWCPNTVVEALSYGTPVICTSNGGTKELVHNSGIIIEEKPYNLEFCKLYQPPEVSPKKVASALDQLMNNPVKVNRPDLDISITAKAYENIMLKTIEEYKNKHYETTLKEKPTPSTEKISILMSVYNGEKFLKEAIESILNQTFSEFEFLIVNDASTDNTLDIINSFKDPRIKLINNKKNLGLARSLNKGLKKARGKYIARLDADDISLPGRLEIQYSFLENNPEIKLVGSGCHIIDEQGITNGSWKMPCWHRDILKWAFSKNPFIHSSVMFERFSARLFNSYPHLPYSQDFGLWVQFLYNSTTANIPAPLIKLRQHPNQISQNLNAQLLRDKIRRSIVFDYANNQLKNIREWKKEFINETWLTWEELLNGRKVAIYGCGKHTTYLLNTLKANFKLLNIISFIDDHPREKSINGINVLSTQKFDFSSTDFIIISSDSFQDEMVNKIQQRLKRDHILCFYENMKKLSS